MSAKFMTAILSAGALIATLATSSPAQAGNDDHLKKFLGAAIGLYILNEAIDHRNNGRGVVRQVSPHKYYSHRKYDHRRYGKYQRYQHKGHGKWQRKSWRNDNCRGYGNHGKGCWNRR